MLRSQALLLTVANRTVRLMRKRGLLDDNAFPRSAHEQTLAASLQHRLPFPFQQPPRKRRCAFLEGFSLHANTHTHENDRQGLELLCRYGARGALSASRLSRREDGRLSYQMKRAAADGSTQLVLTPLELTRRLAALVPSPRVHLVHFAGVFAPRAMLRRHVVPKPPTTTESTAPVPPPSPSKPRLDWAALLLRVFAIDLLACPCGGRRQVMAFITEVRVVREILEHLKLPSTPLPWAYAQGSSPARVPRLTGSRPKSAFSKPCRLHRCQLLPRTITRNGSARLRASASPFEGELASKTAPRLRAPNPLPRHPAQPVTSKGEPGNALICL